MGIFGGNKKSDVENAILQSMIKLPILDDLIITVLKNDAKWITTCQGYYDNRERVVTIAADMFEIRWNEYENRGDKRVAKVVDSVAYAFTKSGYAPLHCHLNEKGKVDVTQGRVICLWCSLVKERLQAKLPQCEFGEIYEYEDHSTFTYRVPAMVWRRWF